MESRCSCRLQSSLCRSSPGLVDGKWASRNSAKAKPRSSRPSRTSRPSRLWTVVPMPAKGRLLQEERGSSSASIVRLTRHRLSRLPLPSAAARTRQGNSRETSLQVQESMHHDLRQFPATARAPPDFGSLGFPSRATPAASTVASAVGTRALAAARACEESASTSIRKCTQCAEPNRSPVRGLC